MLLLLKCLPKMISISKSPTGLSKQWISIDKLYEYKKYRSLDPLKKKLRVQILIIQITIKCSNTMVGIINNIKNYLDHRA